MKKIFALLFIALHLAACKFAESEIYSIPDGFTGNVIIFTHIKTGSPAVYNSNGKRVYSIPERGILLTRFRDTYGIINKTFLYRRKDGTTVDIKGIANDNDKIKLDQKQIYAFYGNDVTLTFPKSKDTLGVQIITICTPGNFEVSANEAFVKKITNANFLPVDLTYEKLYLMRKLANGN